MTELEEMTRDRDDWKAEAIRRAKQRDDFDESRREWQEKAEALAVAVEQHRRTLQILLEHVPSWSDDFLIRAALLALEDTKKVMSCDE